MIHLSRRVWLSLGVLFFALVVASPAWAQFPNCDTCTPTMCGQPCIDSQGGNVCPCLPLCSDACKPTASCATQCTVSSSPIVPTTCANQGLSCCSGDQLISR